MINTLIGSALNLFFTIMGIFVLIYAMWGAFDWIISGGDEEKLSKAKRKIASAFIGLFIAIALLSLWIYYLAPQFGLANPDFSFVTNLLTNLLNGPQ